MARRIYKIKLKENLFPALSEAEALEMQNNGNCRNILSEDEVMVSICVPEADTVKMFLLAKTMYDMEKFTYQEVAAAVRSVAMELGHWDIAQDVADIIITWVERFDEVSAEEFQEWLIG